MKCLGVSHHGQLQILQLVNAPRAVRKLKDFQTPHLPVSGDLLKAMRLRKGWTQERLAVTIEVRQGTIAKWERGDAWPSAEHMQSICYSLEALPDEVVALTSGPLILANAEPIQNLEQALDHYFSLVFGSPVELRELGFFSLESQLFAQSGSCRWATPLLGEVHARHSQDLLLYNRYSEARIQAGISIRLGKENELKPEPLVPALLAQTRAAVSSPSGSPLAAIRTLEPWLRDVHAPEFRAWLLSDIGGYYADRKDVETAIEYRELACETVANCENRSELMHRRLDLARTLAQFNRSDEATELLSPYPEYTHSLDIEVSLANFYKQLTTAGDIDANDRSAKMNDLAEA